VGSLSNDLFLSEIVEADILIGFFLNSAIAPNGLEVSMGARETVCPRA
jgi:hypothetical protein